ncbi:protein kinase, partial [bacterium]|nr:protein kinase [bacterium]
MNAREDDNPDETIWQGASGQLEARQASSLSEKPWLEGYDLNYLLGRGSYGEVWAGKQKSTGQSVAVKFFLAGDLSYIRRELERLREVSQHFAVVGLVDADLDHHPPYFVMPLLVRSLAEEESPGPAQAAGWMSQLAEGLRHSHEKGLLHCDLKPSNVMLDESGRARLVDFGQSRQQGDGVVAWGTLGFMAPEQAALGNETSQTSPTVAWDVYGLGATIYRLLTGFCPYWSQAELHHLKSLPLATRLRRYRQQIEIAPLIPLRKVCARIDADLADLIQACLASDPARRPPGMAAVLEDLERRRQGQPLLCRRPWNWGYLVSKWARRPALVAASLATVSLLTSATYSYFRLRQANQEQQRLIQALVIQQVAQAENAHRPEEAQLWRCRALENDPSDPLLRTQLAREHFGLQAFSAQTGSWECLPGRPELIQWTESQVLLWESGKARAIDLAFKPLKVVGSGRLLAIFGRDKAQIYDLRTHQIKATIELSGPTLDAAWDSDQLIVLAEDTVTRWSTQGKALNRQACSGQSLSPDGLWTYAGGQLSQLKTRQVLSVPPGEPDPVRELFSPNGSWFRTGNRLIGLKGQADWVLDGDFACFVDEQRVAIVNGSRLTVCSQTDSPVQIQEPVEALEVKARGDFLLVAGEGNEFSLWDSRTGARLTSKSLHKAGGGLRQLLFNGDASLLVGDDGLSSRIWRLDPPRPTWSASIPGRVLKLAWGENQSWLWAGGEDGLARYSLQGQQLEQILWKQPARSYAFSPRGVGVAQLEGGLRFFLPGHQQV